MSQKSILATVMRCLESGAYTNLTITCGDDVYKGHKMMVCTQSNVLAATIKFGGKETEQSNINLPEDEPAVAKLLVKFLYTGDYRCAQQESVSPSDSATGPQYNFNFPHTCASRCSKHLCTHHRCGRACGSDCTSFIWVDCYRDNDNASADYLLIHAKMYEIADKYNIADLKELSRKKFSMGCALYWNKDAFPKAAHYALSTTVEEDKGLRKLVSNTVAKHIELILKPEVEVLVKDFNWLAYSILRKKATTHRHT